MNAAKNNLVFLPDCLDMNEFLKNDANETVFAICGGLIQCGVRLDWFAQRIARRTVHRWGDAWYINDKPGHMTRDFSVLLEEILAPNL